MSDKKSIIGAMISDDNIVEKQPVIVSKVKQESRSKRVNFLMKPSIYAKVQKKCKRYSVSISECINQFLEKWVEEE